MKRSTSGPLADHSSISSVVPLADGVVDVWRADLDAQDDVEELLAPDELERASTFVREVHRRRWARARGILRALIGAYQDSDPRRLRFANGPHGRPELDPVSSLRFSVSHSSNLALYAFTLDRAVGVDVEAGERLVDAIGLARRVLGDSESRRIESFDESQREREFLRAWTRLEAELKCLGTGLAGERDSVQSPPLWISEVDFGPVAVAAVAVEGAAQLEVRLWDWPLIRVAG